MLKGYVMLSFIFRAVLPCIALLTASAGNATVADDTKDVPSLIAAYHQAVTGHDGPRLAQMFMPAGTAWFSVLSQRAWTQMRTTNPGLSKIRPGGFEGFVKMVSTSKAALDPQHSNLHISSDGEVAAVTFDFRFLIDGKEQNRGAENWQLIRTADGWRIVSIIFSSTPSSVTANGANSAAAVR
jgi:ketosteroid isomerase-like protein